MDKYKGMIEKFVYECYNLSKEIRSCGGMGSMDGFQPTIGKWYDYENYDIDKPQWKRLLNIAEKHRDTSEVRNVMS